MCLLTVAGRAKKEDTQRCRSVAELPAVDHSPGNAEFPLDLNTVSMLYMKNIRSKVSKTFSYITGHWLSSGWSGVAVSLGYSWCVT